ncbi:MAG: hypothetical protein CVT63_05825 [Candidatus Anoxymicrobium japonicum]|uniref:Uncharacterized protein n=1 Tax=Candidatus Anoxymicrobium japonicum TaxID=2013648 RepID=A0A2N3G5H5_9ACTN|nr:MAG: hypothetical protein CVT63_05825 [Candidatus Anoxymicrobium japonicum]
MKQDQISERIVAAPGASDAPVQAPARPEAPVAPTPSVPTGESAPLLKPLLERPLEGELPDITEVD